MQRRRGARPYSCRDVRAADAMSVSGAGMPDVRQTIPALDLEAAHIPSGRGGRHLAGLLELLGDNELKVALLECAVSKASDLLHDLRIGEEANDMVRIHDVRHMLAGSAAVLDPEYDLESASSQEIALWIAGLERLLDELRGLSRT